MLSLTDNKVHTSKLINNREYTKVEGHAFNFFYNNHEIEATSKRRFVCHIVLEDTWKVSTYKSFYDAQNTTFESLKKRIF